MIRHIVMWNFKEEFSDEENLRNAQKVKAELDALASTIQGIIFFEVIISTLKSGNRDIVLNSLLTDEKALAEYQVHPEHIRVSDYVGTVMKNRSCIDYIEQSHKD